MHQSGVSCASWYLRERFKVHPSGVSCASWYLRERFTVHHSRVSCASWYLRERFTVHHSRVSCASWCLRERFTVSHSRISCASWYLRERFTVSHSRVICAYCVLEKGLQCTIQGKDSFFEHLNKDLWDENTNKIACFRIPVSAVGVDRFRGMSWLYTKDNKPFELWLAVQNDMYARVFFVCVRRCVVPFRLRFGSFIPYNMQFILNIHTAIKFPIWDFAVNT